MIKTLQRLTQEVTNPDHDKRCKHGQKAILSLPAGTKFLTWVSHGTYDAGATVVELDERIIGLELARRMLANCEPCPMETAKDAITRADVPLHCSDDLLQHMVDTGVLTLDQIHHAAQTLYTKWYNET